ncbi:hypothetical protein BSKO_13947 [Bryopsis sp. KO-2023]|nr:hypothetical protein BSKO_13947 [Bryopsis sp. KO-2023]
MRSTLKRGVQTRKRRVPAPREAREEHFVLRVEDSDLAEQLREAVKEQVAEAKESGLKLEFTKPGRDGSLEFRGTKRPVRVLDLPTFVECYKTLDDIHCVKLTDVSQVLHVGANPPLDEGNELESRDGLTHPFRNVRRRVFKPPEKFSAQEVTSLEEDLLAMFDGWAPPQHKFVDTEEQCVQKDGEVCWEAVEEEPGPVEEQKE